MNKLFIIYWRGHNGATGDIYAEARTPAEAVTCFRNSLREHKILNRVMITGIAEEAGHLSLQVIQ